MIQGTIQVEELMVAHHHGIKHWRAFWELYKQHMERREETEGLKWWHRAKTDEERREIRALYGEALDRHRSRTKVDNYPFTQAIY